MTIIKNILSWFKSFWVSEPTFTVAEVRDLLNRVDEFNAGAVDSALSRHIARVFEEWREDK